MLLCCGRPAGERNSDGNVEATETDCGMGCLERETLRLLSEL